MGIVATILTGLAIWAADIAYKKFSSNNNDTISLLQPLDDTRLDKENKKINFSWKSIGNANKYILLLEKYSSNDGKWIPADDGGRYIASQASIPVPINHLGSFKWKIIAKDSNEKDIAESTWYFFKITSSDIIPSQKLKAAQKEATGLGASDNL